MDRYNQPTKEFENELAHLINKFSLENGSDTPDFVLAQYLCSCLSNFNHASYARKLWHQKDIEVKE